MGWLGRGLGSFGSDVGRGYDINLDWKQRLQNMVLENARQKQSELKNALDMQELQQRIKQMQSPQPAGIVKGPSGETSGVTFDPATSTYSVKNLIPGTPPEPKFPNLQAAAAYYLQKGDFDKLKLVNDEMDRARVGKQGQEGYSDIHTDTQGNLWGFNKGTNKFERIQTTAKFRSGNEKTPSEYDQRITNYLAANGMKDTPSNRDKADQALGVRNKQNDRTDAIKAVTTAMNAFKNFQSIQSDALKNASHFSWLGKGKYSMDEAQNRVDAAQKDLDEKRQDAIEKLTEAGMPIPAWLQGEGGGAVPPPPGPPPGRTGKVSVE